MSKILFLGLFLFMCWNFNVFAWQPEHKATLSESMFAELLKKLPSLELLNEEKAKTETLSGCYTNPGPSLKKFIGEGTSGSKLYLLPDNTYIYIEWADVLPPTIYEKGTWKYNKGFVMLESDNSLPKMKSIADHYFLPIVRKNCLFLMGNNMGYSYFLENAKNENENMLFICSLENESSIREEDTENIRNKLMKESWKPEWFKK